LGINLPVIGWAEGVRFICPCCACFSGFLGGFVGGGWLGVGLVRRGRRGGECFGWIGEGGDFTTNFSSFLSSQSL